MVVASGLAGSFGLAAQGSYSAYTAPTRHLEIASATLRRNKRTVQGGGLSGGVLGMRGARRKQPTKDAGGTVSLEVTNRRHGLLESHMFGSAPTGVATGSGFTYSFPLADNVGKYLTMQLGVPDLSGTAHAFTCIGCKLPSVTYSCEIGGLLMAEYAVDARVLSDDEALVAPSYTSNLLPFHGGQLNIGFGGSVSSGIITGSAVAAGVKGFSVTIDRPHDVERFYAGGSGLKAEPVMNGKANITGSLDVDFVDKAQFADLFEADTATSLLFEFTGDPIGGGANDKWALHLPQVFFDTETPALEDEDVVSTTVDFTCTYDDVNTQATLVRVTADATL